MGSLAPRHALWLLLALVAPWPARGADPEPPAEAPTPEEEIVVTATRSPRPRREVPVAVTLVSRTDLERSPAKTADELLAGVPAFGLFRRSSSMAADPSSQGVNLRGVSLSGISRSLVLVDGVPSNDAFAGWVNWRSIPAIAVQRIEVAPGGGSALYGNYALGGVTQIISRPITPLAVEAESEAGSFGTGRVAARISERAGPVGAALDGELLTSDGYPVVADWARGPIDGATPSRHAAVNGRAEVDVAPGLTLGARGSWFWEDYNGGTRYTTATVRRFDWAGSARFRPAAGAVDLAVFGHVSEFGQERTRPIGGAARTSEELNAVQSVPSHDLGGSVVWTGAPLSLAGRHTLSVGTDLRRITGDTHERLSPPATAPDTAIVLRDAGGEQRQVGLFAQDVYDASPALQATLAVRYDRFDTVGGHTFAQSRDGASTSESFPTRTGEELDPKLGLRARATQWLALRGGVYRAFRAPTLDELFRPFQVGTVRTDANPYLRPETLQGGELGLDLSPRAGLTARATGFWNELADPVVNVDVGPNLRQRRNLGRARIRGVEADAGWRFAPRWLVAAAYTFMDPVVTRAPGQEQLVGKQLSQVPKHRGSLSISYDDARLVTGNVQLRYLGAQYEDALNTLPMGEALLVDLYGAWHLTRSADLFLAVQNVLDETYLVGRAGVDTVGQPRFVHGGVRFRTGG
jgi:outer membrane receptor protein involved in Fe transport